VIPADTQAAATLAAAAVVIPADTQAAAMSAAAATQAAAVQAAMQVYSNTDNR